jgi:Photosynthesis system II assembly factor YCF48
MALRRAIVIAGMLSLMALAGWVIVGLGVPVDPQKSVSLNAPTAVSAAVSASASLAGTPVHDAVTPMPASRVPATYAYLIPTLPQPTSTPRPTPTQRPTAIRIPVEPVSTPITAAFSSVPPDPFHDEITDYAFVGTQDIWIVVRGALLHTSDRGKHWIQQYDHDVSYVGFADINHGWVVADNTIVGTEDGGQTWHLQFTVATPAGAGAPYYVTKAGEINSLSFASAQRAWASTSAGLVATTNGGKHWARVNSNEWIIELSFTDERHGWGFAGGVRRTR